MGRSRSRTHTWDRETSYRSLRRLCRGDKFVYSFPTLVFPFPGEWVCHFGNVCHLAAADSILGGIHRFFFGSVLGVYSLGNLTGFLVLLQVPQHGKQAVTLTLMFSQDASF